MSGWAAATAAMSADISAYVWYPSQPAGKSAVVAAGARRGVATRPAEAPVLDATRAARTSGTSARRRWWITRRPSGRGAAADHGRNDTRDRIGRPREGL